MKIISPSTQKKQFTLILVFYLFFASIFGFAYRFALNPDGISQLILAGYAAEGKFLQSVSSSWSLLLIWLISPFIYFGFDGLTSARIAVALTGIGLLFSSWLLSLRFGLSQNIRFIAMMIHHYAFPFFMVHFPALLLLR
ncbi:MAG: hypothetical protein HY758_10460 [Nitrospirae bacterium]|nr:hypothetical protein [Nitrospirota bacterium]